jgi:hypothetical protein
VISVACLGASDQNQDGGILRTVRENHMYLVDLRNWGYRIAFPQEGGTRTDYDADYLYSFVAPSGRALFAVRRTFDGRNPPEDTLIRRTLTGSSVGPEEILSSPFQNVFSGAASPSEKYMLIVGRSREPSTLPWASRDGVYLWDRSTNAVGRVAAAPNAGLTEDFKSLNVNDRGDIIVYEDRGEVKRLAASGSQLTQTEQYSGRFPTLMPDGKSYLYWDHGWLMMSDANGKHEVLPVENMVGGLRVSPAGGLVAFGVDSRGGSSLRICEIKTKTCLDGPVYVDWIAGRETFWIRR